MSEDLLDGGSQLKGGVEQDQGGQHLKKPSVFSIIIQSIQSVFSIIIQNIKSVFSILSKNIQQPGS